MQRLEYIDTMKGILIFFVVLLHLPWVATMLCDYECDIFEWSKYHTQFISAYYMSAFFFVTGYCSDFDKEAKSFLQKNAKILLVPAIVFSSLDIIKNGAGWIGLLFYGGNFWFLPALFWTKGIYYFLRKYFHGKMLVLLVIALCAFGFFLHQQGIKNFWSIEHGMAFLPIIYLGEYVRHEGKRAYEYVSILLFIVLYLVCCLFDIRVPVLARTFKPVISEMPLFLVFSCTGCLMILFIAKYITSHSKVLTKCFVFWGKNSLLIYLVSNAIMELLLKFSMWIVPTVYTEYNQEFMFNATVYLTIVILTMTSFKFIVRLFDMKWLKWTLGKF